MIVQMTAAASSCPPGLTRRPVARLAIATEVRTHISTPSAIRFSVPGRPKTGVSSLATSSGTISEVR